jgi:hypothetical protein
VQRLAVIWKAQDRDISAEFDRAVILSCVCFKRTSRLSSLSHVNTFFTVKERERVKENPQFKRVLNILKWIVLMFHGQGLCEGGSE